MYPVTDDEKSAAIHATGVALVVGGVIVTFLAVTAAGGDFKILAYVLPAFLAGALFSRLPFMGSK